MSFGYFTCPLGSYINDRFSYRFTALLGSSFGIIGFLLASVSSRLWMMYPTFSLQLLYSGGPAVLCQTPFVGCWDHYVGNSCWHACNNSIHPSTSECIFMARNFKRICPSLRYLWIVFFCLCASWQSIRKRCRKPNNEAKTKGNEMSTLT